MYDTFNINTTFYFYRYWDDWIRQPQQRKDRACIRPELSRTKTFGKIGVSKYDIKIAMTSFMYVFDVFSGLFYEKHLKYIKLNEVFVDFTKMNLNYLIKVRNK